MTTLVRQSAPNLVRLRKDLTRDIKRGHAWLYSHSIEPLTASPGDIVELYDRRGDKLIASGIYHPQHPISIRVCRTQPPFELDQAWATHQLTIAATRRLRFFDARTTGYRLLHGEGDGLPGLIIDVYDRTAVIKLDGGAPEVFYQPQGIAEWLRTNLGMKEVIFRPRQRGSAGRLLVPESTDAECSAAGDDLASPVRFLENGLIFSADVWRGQKTGFFLDQRDNRDLIRRLASNCTVLNLFSYNGGFSVAAGMGGARHVTSVDIAAAAVRAAVEHWSANQLEASTHEAVIADCFEYLEAATARHQQWQMVICDPPSFAPNEKSKPQAMAAYGRLAILAAQVTSKGGLLALASCSSHIDHCTFTEINLQALGRAKRKANVIADCGLPIDHPVPMAMPELRYLKFLLLELD